MPQLHLTELIPYDSLKIDLEENIPNELKFHMHEVFLQLRCRFNDKNCKPKKSKIDAKWVECSLLTIDACISRTWEMLNSGYWKSVPLNYRYCYSLCSVLKVMLMEMELTEKNAENEKLLQIMNQVDKGLLLGAPLPHAPNLLTDIASIINNHYFENWTQETKKNLNISPLSVCTKVFKGFKELSYYTMPSMETFYNKIFKPKFPAVLQGCMNHWRALELWPNVNYLKQIAGNRTIPIEIGSRYTDEDWSQKLLTFSEFLETYVLDTNKIGYLAQHQLFNQIPELKNDFTIPEYCNFFDEEGCEESPDINAWFGPGGTVSPLHHDPKNNLLCQIFGYKRIILYSPEDNANLYPYETRMLNNTSQIDPYNPEQEKYPNFCKAEGYMCYLKPGEMLYIPPKWWHHVVGLSPSFSVSFWWS